MIELPDFEKSFEYENNFYLSCRTSRISKLLAHYELFKMTIGLPGAIVECGVFKGASLARFAMFRDMLSNPQSRKILGFDTFDKFPPTDYEPDQRIRGKFIREAGEKSISVSELRLVLAHKGISEGVDLVEGDIRDTVPAYVEEHQELRISMLNLDVDVFEPSVVVLDYLYPRIVKNGILILDDYGVFPGETKAVDDYFAGKGITIQKFDFCVTPCYVVKA